MPINIVGLGPGNPGQMTLETLALLEGSEKNYFRTAIHPVMDFINKKGIPYESFDHYYETESSFEDVYQKIVDLLIKQAVQGKTFVYAVPGNPLFGEQTVVKLIKAAKLKKIDYCIYPGVSFVDVTMNALEEDPIKGMRVMDAFDFKSNPPDPEVATLITQVYDKFMASELKLGLMELYEAEKQVCLLINVGISGEEIIKKIHLWELDRVDEINHLTSLYIPAEKEKYLGIKGTKKIMKILRSDEGCSWDRIQTHESLKGYLLEETYEVIEAIENKDWENLEEELGDVLFQIVFHSEIAKESQGFSIETVIAGINEKMIRRHPHVFLKKEDFDPQKIETDWEAIKRMEKPRTSSLSEEMAAVPKVLPALMAAVKVQEKAAKIGFDWKNPEDVFEKISEETQELKEAIDQGNPEKIQEELGDLLFSAVNLARLLKVQPELIMKAATQKFIERFKKMEKLAWEDKKDLKKCDFNELEILYARQEHP